MEHEIRQIKFFLKTNKKPVVLAILAIVITFFVGLAAVGFIVYKAGIFAKDKVSSLEESVVESSPLDSNENLGVVESVLMNLFSSWVEQTLSSPQTERLKDGLYCLDALGGPSPEVMVAHVKNQLSDARMLTMLDELGASLKHPEPKEQGMASCASWILNG